MNVSNAKDYLPLVQALADGKTIQLAEVEFSGKIKWVDIENIEFGLNHSFYRINPEPKKCWCRVVLLSEGAFAVSCDAQEESFRRRVGFIRWLTDRIEYELPEGDA